MVFDRDYGAWVTYNPVQKAATMASPGYGWQEPTTTPDEMIGARLEALEEMLADLDPNDWIGRIYIKNEMEQLRARLARLSEGQTPRIGSVQEQMLSGAAQEAQRQEREEIMSQWRGGYGAPGPGEMLPIGAEPRWIGPATAGQYPAVTPQQWAIGAVGPTEEQKTYATTTPVTMRDWMRGVATPMGLRPVLGDYVMDPNQRRQAEYWQLYMQSTT